jgi:hypothetical protein
MWTVQPWAANFDCDEEIGIDGGHVGSIDAGAAAAAAAAPEDTATQKKEAFTIAAVDCIKMLRVFIGCSIDNKKGVCIITRKFKVPFFIALQRFDKPRTNFASFLRLPLIYDIDPTRHLPKK